MASTTIRITEQTHAILRDLSQQTGEPLSVLVAKAVERLRREHFLEATNRTFANLREDSEAWEDVLAERAEWEQTLPDGQDDG